MTKVYHYTKGYALNGILNSKEIKREAGASNYIVGSSEGRTVFGAERQVWFTTETEMPCTAAPGIGRKAGVNELYEVQRQPNRGYAKWAHFCKGVYRFEFDALDIGAVQYMNGDVREQMEESGMLRVFEQVAAEANDNVTQWFHSCEDVSIGHVKRVEEWKKGRGWVQVSLHFLNLKFAA